VKFQGGDVIREAHLLQPGPHAGPGHIRHGKARVRREAGVGVVIRKITHFLNFLKNFFRSS
jgi:hypothetical protein